MKTIILFTLMFGSLCMASEPGRPIKVAVFQFKNTSQHRDDIRINDPAVYPTSVPLVGAKSDGSLQFGGKITVERYSERARSLVESELTTIPELTIISRAEVSALELEYERNRSLGGRRTISERASKQHGPDFILFGSILDFSSTSSESRSYGILHRCNTSYAQVYLRVVRLSDEKEVFSDYKTGFYSEVTTQWGKEVHSDPFGEALLAAVREFRTDPRFKEVLLDSLETNLPPNLSQAGGIEILFNPSPGKVRVDLDGIYVGESPTRRRLAPGSTTTIKLSKPGFVTWEAKISPERGLTISPELEPIIRKEPLK